MDFVDENQRPCIGSTKSRLLAISIKRSFSAIVDRIRFIQIGLVGFTPVESKKGQVILSYDFFHGRKVAVLAHSLTKEDTIPTVEIERALKRKRQFEQNPEKHTYAKN